MKNCLRKCGSVQSIVILVCITLGVGATAITTQSLWMDEGNAIAKAIMPSISEMWLLATRMGGSEIQMPVFMLSLWGWEKIVGDSEYALRAINLPFLIVMVLAFRRYRYWPLVCLVSPFVLYYVGELRPYMFQMAGAALGFSVLCRMLESDRDDEDLTGVHVLLLSAIFMAATSLTSAIFSAGLLLGMIIARPSWLQKKPFWGKVVIWLPVALMLAGYYIYTLAEGYGGTAARGGGILSMGFGFYEMMGLLGLGPGREYFRSMDILGLLHGYPWLPMAAVVIIWAWIIGLKRFIEPYRLRSRIAFAFAVMFPLIVFVGVSVIFNFSVLGRHMSFLIPVLLLPLACAIESAVKRPGFRPAVVGSMLCACVSCLMLRFSSRHVRDDFRGATSLALDALHHGRAVLWKADMLTPIYYAIHEGGMPLGTYIQKLELEAPRDFASTDVIFINRPDFHYEKSAHRQILAREGFGLRATLAGFEIWDRRQAEVR